MPSSKESDLYPIPNDPHERRIQRLRVVAQNMTNWHMQKSLVQILVPVGLDAIEDLVKNGQHTAIDAILEGLPSAAQALGYQVKSKLE